MHLVSPGFLSEVCMWHWLRGWWKVHESEASALTLFHLRVSRTAELSFQGNEPLRDNSAVALRTIVKKCLSCHICFFLPNSVLITTGDQTAPWTSTAPNRTSRLALRITGNQGCEQSINIPEPHPCRSPGKWFLWVLWRSSRLCRSSGYRSRPQAGSGGNTSSWRTEAESRNGICRKK